MASQRGRRIEDVPPRSLLSLPPCVLHMLLTRHGLSGRDMLALAVSGLVARRDVVSAAQHCARRLPAAWVEAATADEPWLEAYARLDDFAQFVAPKPGVLCACGGNVSGQTGLLPPALAPVLSLRRVPRLPSAIHVAAGTTHSLLVAVDGSLYAAGANFNDGRLGLGLDGNDSTNNDETEDTNISGNDFAGHSHLNDQSASQDNSHHVGAGSPALNGNGIPNDGTHPNVVPTDLMAFRIPSTPFTRVPLARHHVVVQCSAGGKHSLALTVAGVVLAAGDNSRGQLGFPDRMDRLTFAVPPLPRGAGRIIQIAAGAAHSVLLSETGNVYVCGENRNCQLGLGRSTGLSRASFAEVQWLPEPAVQVAAGEEHTLIVGKSRRIVYGAGLNCAGQLGDGGTCDRASFVPLLSSLRSKRKCASSTTDSALFPVHDAESKNANYPAPCVSPTDVRGSGLMEHDECDCGVGGSRSSDAGSAGKGDHELVSSASAGGSHSLLVTSWGRLLAAGECFFRHGEVRFRNSFSAVTTGISGASAGWSHSVAIAGQACLLAVVGDNPYVQIGAGGVPSRGQFGNIGVPGVALFVAAGGAHTLVLVDLPNQHVAGFG